MVTFCLIPLQDWDDIWIFEFCKVVIYAVHTELLESENPLGYLLLRCLRSYVILDMYAALEVHTAETIGAGRAEVLKFSALMKVCSLCKA
jgi:hypothetical protein